MSLERLAECFLLQWYLLCLTDKNNCTLICTGTVVWLPLKYEHTVAKKSWGIMAHILSTRNVILQYSDVGANKRQWKRWTFWSTVRLASDKIKKNTWNSLSIYFCEVVPIKWEMGQMVDYVPNWADTKSPQAASMLVCSVRDGGEKQRPNINYRSNVFLEQGNTQSESQRKRTKQRERVRRERARRRAHDRQRMIDR